MTREQQEEIRAEFESKKEQIIKLYEDGYSANGITYEIEWDLDNIPRESTVRNYLKRWGVDIRSGRFERYTDKTSKAKRRTRARNW